MGEWKFRLLLSSLMNLKIKAWKYDFLYKLTRQGRDLQNYCAKQIFIITTNFNYQGPQIIFLDEIMAGFNHDSLI